jgi:hypothetical protein
MDFAILLSVLVGWGALSIYWVKNGVAKLWLTSFTCGVGCAGWCYAVARDLKWLGRPAADIIYVIAALLAGVGWLAVWAYESQQRRPFR